MRVEIWSDVVCPWCYIGKRRFEKALETLRSEGFDEPVEIIWRSFQLDPTAPVGNPSPAIDAYAKKFGGPEVARQIIDKVTAAAAGDGLEFRMDLALRANTVTAHRALHWALDTGGTKAQGDLKERLLRAYFTDGLDVGDPGTIARCADDCGLDGAALSAWLGTDAGKAEVVADLNGAMEREISAVPSFVINDRFLVPGAQEPETFALVLKRALQA